MAQPRTSEAWRRLLGTTAGGTGSAASRQQRSRAELVEHWSADVWNWLTGVDHTSDSLPWLPDREFDQGVPLIWTTDEKEKIDPADPTAGIKPFPSSLPYLRRYTACVVSDLPEDRILFVDKSRQMFVSHSTLLCLDWIGKTQQGRRMVWSKHTEDESMEMLEDKIRAVHRRLPRWVQDAFPTSMKPAKRVKYPSTGSYIVAANTTAATGIARGGTASVMGIDEAAFQEAFQATFEAALPMAGKIIAVTTAQNGPPGARFFYAKIRPGRDETHQAFTGGMEE